jgi:cyclohexadieny/prephenate dehydrogenase
MSKDDSPLFERVALIGVGLIGASLGLVLKREGLAGYVVGCARTQATLDKALELDIVDEATADPAAAVAGADLVMLCTPVGTFAKTTATIAGHLKPGAVVSDVGSVKQAVIAGLSPLLPDGVHLVPGHPIAGTEHSGPEAGFADLFKGRWCILTPPEGTDAGAVEKLTSLWTRAGMEVEVMDAAHHDTVLAVTSHLPHLIAYTIVGTAFDLEESIMPEVFKFAAGGFRDFTRIAASDPVMWRDIFLQNSDAVLDMLACFTGDLDTLKHAIRQGDGKTLEDLFTRTHAIRKGVIEAHQD